ncbi:MAG: hypothetical protein RJA36_2818 [Pseudomonadota bacterium]
MSKSQYHLVVHVDGTQQQTLELGQQARVRAQAGARYRVLRQPHAAAAGKAQSESRDATQNPTDDAVRAEALAAGVLASRHGDDLRLDYADGSQLQLEGFFQACKGAACAVELPATGGGIQLLSGDSAGGAASADQGYALYAYGSTAEMTGLLQSQGLALEGLKGLSQEADQISYLPPADGFNWAWLAPLALLPLIPTHSAVPTIIKGSVVAGPVLTGNGLVATAYKADGSVLASGAVNADGSFTLTVGNDYQGPVLVKISDTTTGADYFDEASAAPKDLGSDLRALTVVPAPGTYTISVNALTELAVRHLGLNGGDNGASDNRFAGLSDSQIQGANQQVAAAVGLKQDLVLGAPAVAIVTTGGESNAQANDYGRLLAAISGAETGSGTEPVLQALTASLSPNSTPGAVLELLLDGAAKVEVAGLVDAVSDITSQKSNQVTIDTVGGDNRLSADEMAAGVTVTGQAAANAIVTIEWSDVSSGGQPTGTRSVTADAQGHWSANFVASEMPALGATSLKASVGAAAVTRSIYLDAPAAPVVKLHADTGSSASDGLTNDVRVDVSGFVAGWDYSTDGGLSWTAGQDSSFQVSGDGARNVQVRQNVGGHYSPPASLDFALDTLAPTIAISSDKSALKAGETATITFTLSEASSDFTADDVTVIGGSLSNFTGSGKSYSATFTPQADSHTVAEVSVIEKRFTDAAGNANEAGDGSPSTISLGIDTQRPTVAISSDMTSLKAGQSATLTFTLSEASADFTADDVAVSGGSLSNFQGSGTSYTATFTPTADTTTTASVSVASASFSDAAGNPNVDGADANNTAAIGVDTLAPIAPGLSLVADTGASATDGVTANGLLAVTNLEPGARWEYSINGGVDWTSGEGVNLPAGVLGSDGAKTVQVRQIDLAGNVSAPQGLSFTLDSQAAQLATVRKFVALQGADDLIPDQAPSDGFAIPALGDLNGDGRLDLVTGAYSNSQTPGAVLPQAYLQQADGTFVLMGESGLGTTNPFASIDFSTDIPDGIVARVAWPAILDVDGDGKNDLLVSYAQTATNGAGILYYRNTGSAQQPVFTKQADSDNPFASVSRPMMAPLAVGDLNGDGNPDLLVGHTAISVLEVPGSVPGSVPFLSNGSDAIQYWQGNGNGTFTLRQGLDSPLSGFNNVDSFKLMAWSYLGDFNGDGKGDFVVVTADSINPIGFFLGDGNGKYTIVRSGSPFSSTVSGAFSAVGDLDGDGDSDLVAPQADGVVVLRNDVVYSVVLERAQVVAGWSTDHATAYVGQPLKLHGNGAEANAVIQLYVGGNLLAEVQANVKGEWSHVWSGTEPGFAIVAGQDYSLTVQQTDAAGNTSIASAPYLISVCDLPALSAIALSADNGSSSSDFITNVASQTISATLNRALLQTEVVYGSVDGGQTWTDVTNKVSGTTVVWNGAVLPATGSIAFKVLNGTSIKSEFSQAYTLDTVAPAMPDAALANDSSNGGTGFAVDGISNSGALTAPSNIETDAKVEYRVKGPGASDFGNWSASYTAPATDGSADGAYLVEVRQTDKAGNVSASESIGYTLDTSKPAMPNATLTSDSSNGGAGFAADGISNSGAITVPANAEAGAKLEYRVKVPGAAAFSGWSETYTAPVTDGSADGAYVVEVRQTDKAGNVSSSQSINFTLDNGKPATPDAALASDSSNGGAGFAADGISNSGALTAPANTETGAKVEYRVKGAGASGFSSWSDTYAAPATDGSADGAYQVEVRQTDKAGNVSASQSIGYTLDSTKPATPDAVLTATTDDGGAIVVPTNIETGATLEYRLKKDGTSVTGTNDGWSSSYQPPATDGSADGAYTLELRQTDVAGNVSASQSLGFRIGAPVYVPIELSAIASGSGGFVINGQGAYDLSGLSVSGAGDVNGDGLADLIVGAVVADPSGRTDAGSSYLVFGHSGTGAVELSAVAAGSGGFVINGQCGGDWSGYSVSGAGDVNGDGLADLIVGAYWADPSGRQSAGSSYVVFGHSGTSPVELSAVAAGNGGFVINGGSVGDMSGYSVSSAGDVNGDGLADLIVGSSGANPGGRTGAGSSYVVFGRSGTNAVEWSALAAGNGGFVINGQCAYDFSGLSVSGAGDVNGDGLADLFVGAQNLGGHGQGYVVFGRTGTAPVELSAVAAGTGGFVLNDQTPSNDGSLFSVSGVGDVNGDGLADLSVDVSYAQAAAGDFAGRSFVVFGRTGGAAVDLSAVAAGSGGFVINGQCAFDQSGYSVSGAGDVNGDGLADLIVAAPFASSQAGRSYVVYGRSDTSAVELSVVAAGSGGFVINGQCAFDQSGYSVSSAGDVNGDGLADLIVGANKSAPDGRNMAGRSYVIFGATDGAFAQTAVDQLGTSGADVMSDGGVAKTLVAGAGDDSLSATAASVLYGGAGNDTFTINGAMITALQKPLGSGGNLGQLARIDGGSGLDSLVLSESDSALDLTQIANQAAGDPETGSRLSSIERIDLTGTGNNMLTLGAADVRDLAGMNVYNSGNGWTGLAASVPMHQLLVDGGGSGDALNATGTWKELAQVSHGGQTYRRLVQGNAELLVDNDITLNVAIETVPTVTSVAFSSATGTQNGLLNMGDTVLIEVRFNNVVKVSGFAAPQLALSVGGSTGQANYISGSNSNTLVFQYFVGEGLTDLDGIAIGANAISLPSGGPFGDTKIRDASGIDAVLDHAAVAANAGYRVDSVTPAAPNASLTPADNDGGAIVAPTNIETGATLEYRLKKDGTNVTATNDGWSGSYTPPATDGSADGAYTLELRQTDMAGNISASQNMGFRIGVPVYAPIELSAIAASSGGFVINGQDASDKSGWSVSSAGDVNGDGLADLIVGAPHSNLNSGRSYVVFGKSSGAAVELSALAGSGGFVINGQCTFDYSGLSVSGAGDVNGDGLADLIVGADYFGSGTGRSYVVFGKTGGAAVSLSALGNAGFSINAAASGELSGHSVSSAGDVNGDGLADLIVGAPAADPAAGLNAGRSYVVYGRTGTTAVELSAVALGTGGFVINGAAAGDNSGGTATDEDQGTAGVASAGDVNGDGLADLIIGAKNAAGGKGRSYVVFGKSSGVAVELSALAASAGFVINGQCAGDNSGWSVSGAGDVNGDGLADLVVGTPNADPATRADAGRSYVVFGKTSGTAVELSALGSGGFMINGQCASDGSGYSVSSAGDVNGDGLADLIIGAKGADPTSGASAGRSYVVYGKTSGTAVELSAVMAGSGGFVINGQGASDQSGFSVSSAGDINGDGLADLIVSANQADPSGRIDAGRSYVIFGSTGGAFNQTALDWLGTSADDAMSDGSVAQTLVAGAGNDSLIANAASVLYGGAGNDTFTINGAMITALQSPLGSGGNVDQLARIDGGGGVDKIVLSGSSLTFDLTQIPQSAMNPEGVSRLSNIEEINITGSGDNTLKLTAKDVLDMTGGMDLVATAKTGRHMLVVTGNAGDTLDLADVGGTTGGWSKQNGGSSMQFADSTAYYNGAVYKIWHSDATNATVLVQKDMTVI